MSFNTGECQLVLVFEEEPVDVLEDKVTTGKLEYFEIKDANKCYAPLLPVKADLQGEAFLSLKEEDPVYENLEVLQPFQVLEPSANENSQVLQHTFDYEIVDKNSLFCQTCNVSFLNVTESELHICALENIHILSSLSSDKCVSEQSSPENTVFEHSSEKSLSERSSTHLDNENDTTGKGKRKRGPFSCEVCSKTFMYNSNLIRHMKSHTGDCPFVCNVCSKTLSGNSYLIKHMRIHTDGRSFNCSVCNKLFTKNSLLIRHMKTHSEDRCFPSDVHNKSSVTKGVLTKHLVTDNKDCSHTCGICNKSFSQKGNLNKHMRIHTGFKLLQCKLCKKSFNDASHLKRHMRAHIGDRPFKCTICTTSFSDKSHYKRHMNIHSGIRPISCCVCEMTFRDQTHCNRHMIIKHRPDFVLIK